MVMANDKNQHVLDNKGNPILLKQGQAVSISGGGQINQNGQGIAQVGLYDVANRAGLTKLGGDLLSLADAGPMKAGTGTIHTEFVERANVDSTTELAELMDSQRQLEANANMIRTQDEMLQKLVDDVGKIS